MTTETIFAVFADFNDPGDAPPLIADEEISSASDDTEEIREQAWTDGYMTGRQERDGVDGDRGLTAKLLTSVHELDASAAGAVDEAALAVASLLMDAVVAATDDTWSARLMDRVRAVAERVRPALTVAPEFLLRDAAGTEHRFGDISQLSRALEGGNTGEDVTIRWHRGEATIGRMALLDDLRNAIVPLSGGLTSVQNARNRT